jgi:hypothetical protein
LLLFFNSDILVVCGNGKVEPGEDCEIGIDGATAQVINQSKQNQHNNKE